MLEEKYEIKFKKKIETIEVGSVINFLINNLFRNNKFIYDPLYDEDSHKLFFNKILKNKYGNFESAFYINLDCPNGYWHNHTLT